MTLVDARSAYLYAFDIYSGQGEDRELGDSVSTLLYKWQINYSQDSHGCCFLIFFVIIRFG